MLLEVKTTYLERHKADGIFVIDMQTDFFEDGRGGSYLDKKLRKK